jgi:predicted nucleotide-binding protein (sugar kinase/HSP70/actin superfamily)
MTTLAFQPWGNYAIALEASAESLRVNCWTSTSSTPEILRLGVEASPEFSCLPFKGSTGHFIKAALEGAEYGVIVNSIGTCRLRYYRAVQQKLLEERGLDLYIFGLGYDGFKPPLIRHFDPDLKPFLKSVARAMRKLEAVELMEKIAWRKRARELHKGDTTRVMNESIASLKKARTVPEIRALIEEIPARFEVIQTDNEMLPLRVGLLGEATLLRDRYLNHNIEEVLGSLGVEVTNFFLMGTELRNIFSLGWRRARARRELFRLAHPYLNALVVGHALESVAYSNRCANEGYDGIIHVCPTGCMPEISIRPILSKLSSDRGIPLLECSFDEHTSHVGVVTRLEAFVDILSGRRKKKRT